MSNEELELKKTEGPDSDAVDHVEGQSPKDKPAPQKSNAVEEQAMQMGWRPKEEWDGDPDEFVDAKEFVSRQKFYDRIDSQNRKIKDLEKTLGVLTEHHKKVYETSYKQALVDLRAQKVKALEEGEYEKVAKIEEQIDETKEKAVIAQQALRQPQQQGPHPEFMAWVNENRWYAEDAQLRSEADRIGIAYAALYNDKPAEEIVKYVAKEIKRLHPDKFRNPNKDRASVVEGGAKSKPASKSASDYTLTEDEERTMKTFIRQGIMTKDEYIKELQRVKGI